MIKKQCQILLFLAISLLLGCDKVIDSFKESLRSGSIAYDDVEAPLSEKAKKYKNALNLSNDFLRLWQKKDFEKIYQTMIDPEVKDLLRVEKLADIYKNVNNTYGDFVGYKPSQWAFEPKKAKKQYFLFSIKRITHKKRKLNYIFQFVLDGEYKKLAGFYVREKPALRAPGQLINSKQ